LAVYLKVRLLLIIDNGVVKSFHIPTKYSLFSQCKYLIAICALVDTVMKLRVPQKAGNFLAS
jgi:hypothetical protein